jgi:glycosyltransferase involved in cell wall biosynthesis
MKILSIIVPIYNVEKYLAKCLHSILSISLDKDLYEVILVNDGSSDKSADIAQEICMYNSNVILCSQENHGLSAARNHGLTKATGKYIWFVDSDDYIESQNVDRIINILMSNEDIDIVMGIYNYVNSNFTKVINDNVANPGQIISGKDALLNGYNPGGVWRLIYKRSFITENNLDLYVGISREDVEFNLKAMTLAQKVFVTDIIIYNYIKHINTLTTATTREGLYFNISSDIVVHNSIIKFTQEIRDKELRLNLTKRVNSIIFGMLLGLIRNKEPLIDLSFKQQLISDMRINGVYPLRGPFLSKKSYFISKVLNIEFVLQQLFKYL